MYTISNQFIFFLNLKIAFILSTKWQTGFILQLAIFNHRKIEKFSENYESKILILFCNCNRFELTENPPSLNYLTIHRKSFHKMSISHFVCRTITQTNAYTKMWTKLKVIIHQQQQRKKNHYSFRKDINTSWF